MLTPSRPAQMHCCSFVYAAKLCNDSLRVGEQQAQERDFAHVGNVPASLLSLVCIVAHAHVRCTDGWKSFPLAGAPVYKIADVLPLVLLLHTPSTCSIQATQRLLNRLPKYEDLVLLVSKPVNADKGAQTGRDAVWVADAILATRVQLLMSLLGACLPALPQVLLTCALQLA